MKYKSKKLNLVIAIILFIISAIFIIYGVYMIKDSIEYVDSYREISSITPDDAVKYVVSSSIMYIGFSILIFIGGFVIFSLRKNSSHFNTNENVNSPISNDDYTSAFDDANNIDNVDSDEINESHPENNPYYVAPTHSETYHENPMPDLESISLSETAESTPVIPSATNENPMSVIASATNEEPSPVIASATNEELSPNQTINIEKEHIYPETEMSAVNKSIPADENNFDPKLSLESELKTTEKLLQEKIDALKELEKKRRLENLNTLKNSNVENNNTAESHEHISSLFIKDIFENK